MKAVEFETELRGQASLALPPEIAGRLPKSGRAKVIVLIDEEGADDAAWSGAAYDQFMRDDDPEDAVYDQFA